MVDETLRNEFRQWLDRILVQHLGTPVAAYNFNLYEHPDSFGIQLVGAPRYDPDDPSWPCDENFSSGEDLFEIRRELVGDDWQCGLSAASDLIKDYIHSGAHAEPLKAVSAVGVGFVDGDVEIVYSREDS